MIRARWQRLEALFEQARQLSDDAQAPFLATACPDDEALAREVAAMLAADGAPHALAVERLVVDAAAHDDSRDTDNAPDPRLQTCVGAWRLIGVLGSGGMGTVYRAERADGQYQQQAAVKLARLGRTDASGIERFRTERQVLAHLRHPNIASLLDGGFTSDGTPYLVMELVDGVPITEWCAAQRLSLEARLRLFRIVCDAVQHAHRALVVHRDLKPTNVFVTRTGEVKLLDFGIAKLLDPGAWAMDAVATVAEMRLLTPEYAAPEQRANGHITTATDVYTLGVVLYELVTGTRPATPPAAPSAARRHSTGSEAPRWRVHGDLDRIVLTALREEPERRYVSAGQLGEEVGRFLDGRPVLAHADSVGYRVRTFLRRHRVAASATAAVVSCLLVAGVVSVLQSRALAVQERVARDERDKAERIVQVLVELFESTNPSIRPDGDRMTVGEFLAGAETRALAQLRQTPIVRARLQQVFGLISHTRGQYDRARGALEEALTEQRRLLGPDHPDALESLQALGEVRYGAGDEPSARLLLEESLERRRRVYGTLHEKTARALHAMAPIVARDDSPRAGAMLTEALRIRRAVLAPQHPDIAQSLAARAEYDRRRGQFVASRRLYDEALAIGRAGEPHSPRLVGLLNDYASFLGSTGADADAEPIQREAIALGRRVLGPSSLPLANLVNNLGVTLTRLGRLREAELTFRDGFDRHVAIVGDGHWRTRNAARNVGRILALQQRYDESLHWMDRAIAAPTGIDPSRDPGLLGIVSQRAAIVFRLGRRDEAVRELTRAASRLATMSVAEAEGVRAANSLLLARALNDLGQPVEAEARLAATAAWYEQFEGDHALRAEADCERARARVLQGFVDEGRARLDRCLPIYRRWGLAEREVVDALTAAWRPRSDLTARR